MKYFLEEAKKLTNEMINHRRYFHQNPEVHMNLPLTKTYIIEKLVEMGYNPEACGSGIVALAGGLRPGKTFLLRADMDALPIQEQTDLPFKSLNGNMHACGHDFHAAMLLGAAKLLKQHEDQIEGTVKIMFQPAEETMEGAKSMIEAGVLENPKVDAAMMVHIISGFPLLTGTCATFGPGVSYASVDWFRIDIQGKGGHGAQPEFAVNPLNTMSHINMSLQEIVAQEISSSDSAVLTIGEMHGGDTANIIPDSAYMTGTIRTFNDKIRQTVKQRLVEIAEQTAAAKRTKATVTFTAGAPCVVCDREVRTQVLSYITDLLGTEKSLDVTAVAGGAYSRVSSSEDFAYIAERVPSVVVWLMSGSPEEGYVYPSHHPKTDFSEEGLPFGAAVYASVAVKWLTENSRS